MLVNIYYMNISCTEAYFRKRQMVLLIASSSEIAAHSSLITKKGIRFCRILIDRDGNDGKRIQRLRGRKNLRRVMWGIDSSVARMRSVAMSHQINYELMALNF